MDPEFAYTPARTAPEANPFLLEDWMIDRALDSYPEDPEYAYQCWIDRLEAAVECPPPGPEGDVPGALDAVLRESSRKTAQAGPWPRSEGVPKGPSRCWKDNSRRRHQHAG
jgi:hypothetical protein